MDLVGGVTIISLHSVTKGSYQLVSTDRSVPKSTGLEKPGDLFKQDVQIPAQMFEHTALNQSNHVYTGKAPR